MKKGKERKMGMRNEKKERRENKWEIEIHEARQKQHTREQR
jgi:hypothetical protein